jgi:tetratricopeptide (TPR) repeat protein
VLPEAADPLYWISVCRGAEAADTWVYGTQPVDLNLRTYPILLLPAFPAAIEARYAGDSFAWEKAHLLHRTQDYVRVRAPREHAQLTTQLGIDLLEEVIEEAGANGSRHSREQHVAGLETAVDCFTRARPVLEAMHDPQTLAAGLAYEAEARSGLAGLKHRPLENLERAIALSDEAAPLLQSGEQRRLRLERRADFELAIEQLGLRQASPESTPSGEDDADGWIVRADELVALGDAGGPARTGAYDAAIESYSHAVALDGARVAAWAGMARAYAALEKWDEAMACADHALVLDPRNELARRARDDAKAEVHHG